MQMIATMPKKKISNGSGDGRRDRYKPVSARRLAVWANDFAEFADSLNHAAKMAKDNKIEDVAFDGARGFDEVMNRINRAVAEAVADVKKSYREMRMSEFD